MIGGVIVFTFVICNPLIVSRNQYPTSEFGMGDTSKLVLSSDILQA